MKVIFNGKDFKNAETKYLLGWLNEDLANKNAVLKAVAEVLKSYKHELEIIPYSSKTEGLLTPKNLRIEEGCSITYDILNDDFRWACFYHSPKENRMPAPLKCAKAVLKVLQEAT